MSEKEYIDLVKQQNSNLYRLTFLCFPDKEVATKIVKETFAKLWLNLARVDRMKAKNWIFSTNYRVLLEHVRKLGSYGQAPEEFIYKEYSETDFNYKSIHPNFGSLTIKQRTLIALIDLEAFEFQDVGDLLWIDVRAVKIGLFRARRTLKEEMEGIAS